MGDTVFLFLIHYVVEQPVASTHLFYITKIEVFTWLFKQIRFLAVTVLNLIVFAELGFI